MIYTDPQTRKRYSVDKRSMDFLYDMDGDSAIAEEAVPVIGDWVDYTGSGTVNSRSQQQHAGITNTLFGTEAWVEGAKLPDLDQTGNNKATTRRRVKRVLVKLDGNTKT